MQKSPILDHKNIKFAPLFEKCQFSDDELCKPEIENGEWQDYDESNELPGGYALIKEKSYMFCTNGCGVLYITDDGQKANDMEGLIAGIIIEKWWAGEEIGKEQVEKALAVLEKNGDLTRFMPYISMKQLMALASLDANISLFMVVDLNRVLDKYDINTLERVRHFLAQCMHETGGFKYFFEQNSKDGSYYDSLYYYPYIGAGGIHLTHEYEYQAFAIYLALQKYPQLKGKVDALNPKYTGGGGEIGIEYEKLKSAALKLGLDISKFTEFVDTDNPYEILAENYPWETAGYYWDSNGINDIVDSLDGSTDSSNADAVSRVVNEKGTSSFGDRQDQYEMTIDKIKALGNYEDQ